MLTQEKIRRIPNKIKRMLMRFPLFEIASKQIYERNLENHANYLPIISPEDSTLVKSLHQEGVCISSLQTLNITSTPLMLASSEKLVTTLLTLPNNGKHVINIPLVKLMEYPEIFLWGVEEKLLNVIENYIGLPILYHGVEFRREIANGEHLDVRQWHIDVEDYRMLKIIVYLNDVSLNGGPFEYISKNITVSSRQALQYRSGFVSDERMKAVVPTLNWQPCTGRSGTAVFTDTCNVFHRAKPPIDTDRFSITFSYTSTLPIKIYGQGTLPKDEFLKISSRLSQRQSNCITVHS
ncbi:hypothetical protein [Fortiea contorta]|uniref:hypothetical protein n=1 Tax=Fortiea contorta TaxID=1892405 RepID=UPI000347E540|nr:hypothetical protein [Fortiea contorta]